MAKVPRAWKEGLSHRPMGMGGLGRGRPKRRPDDTFSLTSDRTVPGPQPTRFFVKDTKGRSEFYSPQNQLFQERRVSLPQQLCAHSPAWLALGRPWAGDEVPSARWLCHGCGRPITSSDRSNLGSSWLSIPKPSPPEEVGGSLPEPRNNAELQEKR